MVYIIGIFRGIFAYALDRGYGVEYCYMLSSSSLLSAMIEVDEIVYGECPKADVFICSVLDLKGLINHKFLLPVACRRLLDEKNKLSYGLDSHELGLLGYDYGTVLNTFPYDGGERNYECWQVV